MIAIIDSMRVLTLSPVEVWLLYRSDYPYVLKRRNSHFRGELLLACSKIHPEDIIRYDNLYYEYGLGQNPVEWATEFPYASSIFARAVLWDVRLIDPSFEYVFSEIHPLPEPIFMKVEPMWWSFDLKTREIIRQFPLSEENIGFFYDLCQRIESNQLPTDHPALFLLNSDPRAKKARQGILVRKNGCWQVIRLPNWRVTFSKRFGKQYIPELTPGQNYAYGHWREL